MNVRECKMCKREFLSTHNSKYCGHECRGEGGKLKSGTPESIWRRRMMGERISSIATYTRRSPDEIINIITEYGNNLEKGIQSQGG